MWTVGFRFSWSKTETQHKTEQGGDEWSVAYALLGVTRHKSSKSKL